MLTKFVCQLIATSVRFAWLMIVAFVVLVVLSALYVSRHFAISTDVSHLINPGTAWAQRSAAIDTAFPQRGDTTLVVVRAPIPEFANQAASELAAALAAQPAMFHSVNAGANSEFFKRNGLLFLPSEQLTTLARQLSDGRPLLNALAHDPSLRGLSNLLSVTLLTPLQTGQVTLAGMAPLLARSADTVEAALAGRKGGLSWQALADTGSPAGPANALVVVTPVMHYNELQPGAASSQAIRDTAARLQLASRYGATIGLTGSVPLSDDEFASVQEGAALGGAVTVVFVLLILWFALRTAKMVLAVFLTIMGGLLVTAALGLLMVGALNIISVAFAILFIGLGVDFGIQFGMRFRARRLAECDTYCALMAVSRSVALPLTLAAVATSIGFFAFLPTDYRGVAELGLIAGVGILVVAFPSCLTVLPALICALNPPGAASMPGYHWLAPVDRTFQKHRKVLLFGTIALVLAGIPLLWHLRFDFNPLHLKDPNSESMQTLSALAGSDEVGIDNVQVLSPNLTQAKALGERLEDLPEVAKVMSATSFVPDHQPEKMNTIASLADRLLPVLRQTPAPPASDAQRVAALRAAAQA
ncbi:MMPL family transporter, partial [Massilia horti]